MNHLSLAKALIVSGTAVIRVSRHLNNIDFVRDDVELFLLVPIPFVDLPFFQAGLLRDSLYVFV